MLLMDADLRHFRSFVGVLRSQAQGGWPHVAEADVGSLPYSGSEKRGVLVGKLTAWMNELRGPTLGFAPIIECQLTCRPWRAAWRVALKERK